MHLSRELPDYAYSLRSADGHQAKVNDRVLSRSFLLAPDQLVEDWPVTSQTQLTPAHLDAVLAMEPALVILGTGERQVFPPAAVMAACLTKGIGIEVMTNASAARTFNVLAAEDRRVVAAFVLG
ncbi:Mth938-like domain-containing protein [Stenotrophomonas sp. JC08]|uniref:Mth938-like domain-containing protein n=1 Tax=Stenotrophomonas sp. JC08 TaxID=3445779 RepID=UPI003FA334B9